LGDLSALVRSANEAQRMLALRCLKGVFGPKGFVIDDLPRGLVEGVRGEMFVNGVFISLRRVSVK
jgi:hypothetical protein